MSVKLDQNVQLLFISLKQKKMQMDTLTFPHSVQHVIQVECL